MSAQRLTRRRVIGDAALLTAALALPAAAIAPVARGYTLDDLGSPSQLVGVDWSDLVPCDPSALAGRDDIARTFVRETGMESDLALWLGTLVMESKCADRADAVLARVVLRNCADLVKGRHSPAEHGTEQTIRERWMREVRTELARA
jgi:hypothetical protein